MTKFKVIFTLMALFVVLGFTQNVKAQSSPVLYFCEKYTDAGEVSISDRFYPGYLTVMVKSNEAIGLTNCTIQFDKYSCTSRSFSFYKKFKYVVSASMKYIYFEKNAESDMSFDDPGIYRVFLLDGSGATVTSSLIEIINR